MFRLSLLSRSTSLHDPTSPFVQASLQLMKLQLTHKNIVAKGDRGGSSKEARAVEHEFKRDLDTFRAVCTLSEQTSAAKMYAGRIVSAMRHFGMEDDPLVRQLERVMGREALRKQPMSSRNLFFKGVVAAPKSTLQVDVTIPQSSLPSELVGVGRTPEEDLPANAVKVPIKHRGHWVLRDPEIALTRDGRRYDAW